MKGNNQFENSNNFGEMSGGEVQTLKLEGVKSMLPTLKPEEVEDLFRTLQALREEKGLVKKAKFVVEGKNLIRKKVKEVRDKIEEQTKIHEQKKERAQKINEKRKKVLEEFEASLQEIEIQHEKRVEKILKQKCILQNQEQGYKLEQYELKQERKKLRKTPECIELSKKQKVLEKQIKIALAKGDLELVAQKNNELRNLSNQNPLTQIDQEIVKIQNYRHKKQQLLKQCDQEFFNCEVDRINSIEEATELKDDKLKTSKKQNIFQKVVRILLNETDKGNQYQDNVMKAVEKRVEYINKKSIPRVMQSTGEAVKAFEQKMEEKGKGILDRNRYVTKKLMNSMQDKEQGSSVADGNARMGSTDDVRLEM